MRRRSERKRRWFQFSLRGLFVITALASILLGFKAYRVRKQQEAIASILELGGTISYDYADELPGGKVPLLPRWIRKSLGEDWFTSVGAVGLHGTEIGDENLHVLKDLKNLRRLSILQTEVTDGGVAQLKELSSLEYVCLDGTRISQAAADELRKSLPQAEVYTWLPQNGYDRSLQAAKANRR